MATRSLAFPPSAARALAPEPAIRPAMGLVLVAVTVLCWASAFPAIRIAVRGFGPLEVAFLRAAASALALGAIAAIRRVGMPAWRDLPALAALGLVGHSLYTATLSLGQTRIPAATASFLIASAPIWMVVIGRLTGTERVSRWGLAGLLVSLAGVLAISLGRGGALRFNGHALVVLGAALLQAIYSMGQRPLLARCSGLQVVTFATLAAALGFLPWSGRALAQLAQAGAGPRYAVLFLGVVPTAVGYWTWAGANRHLSASVAASCLYLVPPVALLLGWATLGEVPTALSLAGGALVVGGVAMVQRLGRRGASRQEPGLRWYIPGLYSRREVPAMDRASIFMNGRSQAVRLPQSCRFEPGVRSVQVRKVGHAVLLEPVEGAGWDPAYWSALEAMPPMEEEVGPVAIPVPAVEGL